MAILVFQGLSVVDGNEAVFPQDIHPIGFNQPVILRDFHFLRFLTQNASVLILDSVSLTRDHFVSRSNLSGVYEYFSVSKLLCIRHIRIYGDQVTLRALDGLGLDYCLVPFSLVNHFLFEGM